MTALLLLPVILSILVLAAHFLRSGNFFAVAGLLALVPLLALRRSWVATVARSTLWLGSAVWVYTAIAIAADRIPLGEPWQRAALILGGVALLTVFSSFAFRSERVRAFYQGGEEPAPVAADAGDADVEEREVRSIF